MRPASRVLAVLAAALLTVACGEVPVDVAATVDGQEIPMQQLASLTAASSGQGVSATAGQRQALSLLVRLRLLEQAAAARELEISAQDLRAAEEQQLRAFGGTEQLRARLLQLGLAGEQGQRTVVRLAALQRKLAEDAAGEGAGGSQLEQAYGQLIGQLLAEADVQINDRVGRWEAASGSVVPPLPLVGPTRQRGPANGLPLPGAPAVPTAPPAPTSGPSPQPTATAGPG